MQTLKFKFISVLLVFAMLLAFVPAMFLDANATGFTDVNGSEPYAKAIQILGEMGIFQGYKDGSFGVDRTIERAEMTALVIRIKGLETEAQFARGDTAYSDVAAENWASGYINKATAIGMISGDGDDLNRFRPDDTVLYEEALKMILKARDLGSNADALGKWPVGYIRIGEQHNVMDGIHFRIEEAISRADVALMVYNILGKPEMPSVVAPSSSPMTTATPTSTPKSGGGNNTSSSTGDNNVDNERDWREKELGIDESRYDEVFDLTMYSDAVDTVRASVDIEILGSQVKSLSVAPYHNPIMFPASMPGYLGQAYDFNVDGEFDTATLYFEFDGDLWEDPEFEPVIYYFNEEIQELEELPTTVVGNKASTVVTHFSTYVLINKTEFDKAWEEIIPTTDMQKDIMIVVDESAYTTTDMLRTQFIRDIARQLNPNDRMGLVSSRSQDLQSLLRYSLASNTDFTTLKTPFVYTYYTATASIHFALGEAMRELVNNSTSDTKVIFVISDDGSSGTTSAHIDTQIARANKSGITIHTIGLYASQRDHSLLKEIAQRTGGEYFDAEQQFVDINNYYQNLIVRLFNGMVFNLGEHTAQDVINFAKIFNGQDIELVLNSKGQTVARIVPDESIEPPKTDDGTFIDSEFELPKKDSRTSPTEIEAALMAQHIYSASKSDTVDARTVKNNGVNTLWRLVDEMPSNDKLKIGVYAKYDENYRTILGYALVFKGSDNMQDWINNAQQLVGINSNHLAAGTVFSGEFIKANPDYILDITFIGHSKGGGEAAVNGEMWGKDTITFNPSTPKATKELPDNGYVHSYVVRSEILNHLLGEMPLGETTYLKQQHSEASLTYRIDNHYLEAVIGALREDGYM